jgi:hypothetical protein
MKIPGLPNVWNIARRRPWGYPTMQLNAYRLDRILRILSDHGIRETRALFYPDASATELDSVALLFQR